MNNNAPIGVFDSGLGGLTGVREFLKILPDENIVFFGDTWRMPYGPREVPELIKFAKQDIQFLLTHGVKMVIPICGTVSSTFPKEIADELPVPYLGVIDSAVDSALASTKSKKIGVVGTVATIYSGAYTRAILQKMPDAEITANSCPKLVPLIESGEIQPDNAVTLAAVQEYFAPLLEAEVDTIILGCTHYPVITEIIRKVVGQDVTLIDPGKETVKQAAVFLKEQGMLAQATGNASVKYFVSGSAEKFGELASIFLGLPVEEVTQIDIESIQV
jgi:glutamate racemase